MPLNPALFANVPQARVDPAAFDTSNALNRAMQMSQFIQQNELARRKLAEADMLKNALANVDLSNPQSVANLLRIPGGAQAAASLQQFQTGQQTAAKAALADRMKMFETNLARVRSPGEAQQWVTAVSQDPVLRPHLSEMGFDPIAEMGQIPQDDAGIPKWKSDLLATPESIREAAKPIKLSAGETVGTITPDGKLNVFGTAPARPAQPLAPSITEIQDPTNPSQTLRIDARVYKGGGLGSPGVIGLGVPKTPQVSVTTVGEKAESGEYGKLLVEDYKGIQNAAIVAAKTLPALEANLATLDKGFDTGFGAGAKAAGAKVLAALGVKEAENFATDAQTFVANANAAVLNKQLEQKGPQTEADAQRITSTGAQLGNTKEANRFLIKVARAQLKRDIAQRNFYRKWRDERKTFEGAESAWIRDEGGKSLFDSPELKDYAVSAVSQIPTPAAQIPTPAASAARTVVRTGTSGGRKVIQYSDGSIEYAD
jgi:hypothetical protein